MPSSPLVQFKSTEPDKHLQKAMFMQQVGKDIGNLGASVGAAVDQYQKTKADTRMKEIAAYHTASVLAGGPDKMPHEATDKLEGVLGFPMPRDEEGHIIVEPSMHDMMERTSIAYMRKDPEAAGRVLSGVSQKDPSPVEIGLREKEQEKDLTIAAMTADTAQKKNAFDIWALKENNIAKIQEIRAQGEEALKRAGATAKERNAYLEAPSEFAIDNTTGEPLTHIAATSKLGPNESYNQRFTTLTNGGMDKWAKMQETQAKIGKSVMDNQLSQARLDLAKLKLQNVVKPGNLAEFNSIMTAYRKAQLSKNPDAITMIETDLQNFLKKQPEFAHDPTLFEQIKGIAPTFLSGMQEWMTGEGAHANAEQTREFMGTLPLGAPSPGATGPTVAPTTPAPAKPGLQPRQSSGAVPGRPAAKPKTPVVDTRPGTTTTGPSARDTPYATTSNDNDLKELGLR